MSGMKSIRFSLFFTAIIIVMLSGCATSPSRNGERGPGGTIAYYVEVECTEPGARIEVNDDYVGKTPMTLKIFGDQDGTFHNFGSQDYIIKVFPVRAGQHVQTKAFRTGGWWSSEDTIPKRIYFDLDQKTEGFSIDLPQTKPTTNKNEP